jgi:SAM-dependent methyltransferase
VHLFRERLLLRLFRRAVACGHVLDAGCGSGSLAFGLCRCGYDVDGVEDSPEFVEFVRKVAARRGLEQKLRVQQGSVTKLSFSDDQFDGLVCGEVLEHITPDQGGDTRAVSEFHRVLKVGAPCVVSVPFNPALWDDSDVWARHVRRYTRSGLIGLFENAGFVVERTRVWGFPLGRLYHRLLFAPWLKRTAGIPLDERETRADTRVGRSPLLVQLVSRVLHVDELFSRFQWGRGILLVGRKKA